MKSKYYLSLVLSSLLSVSIAQNFKINIEMTLQETTKELISEFDQIPEERKKQIQEVGSFLISESSDSANLSTMFICTHNSRRSHLADLWFKYGLEYYGVDSFASYSGGTEATAFNPNAIEAIERAGFVVEYDDEEENPIVFITPGHYPIWRLFSKKYTHESNPKRNFIAIMVCSDADRTCPFVEGATGRFSLPYDDPRYFDETPAKEVKYDETVATIGREMLYLTHYIKQNLILNQEASK